MNNRTLPRLVPASTIPHNVVELMNGAKDTFPLSKKTWMREKAGLSEALIEEAEEMHCAVEVAKLVTKSSDLRFVKTQSPTWGGSDVGLVGEVSVTAKTIQPFVYMSTLAWPPTAGVARMPYTVVTLRTC